MPVLAADPAIVRPPGPAAAAGGARPAFSMALKPPSFLIPLLQDPVAIFGGGVSGQAVRELLALAGVLRHQCSAFELGFSFGEAAQLFEELAARAGQ